MVQPRRWPLALHHCGVPSAAPRSPWRLADPHDASGWPSECAVVETAYQGRGEGGRGRERSTSSEWPGKVSSGGAVGTTQGVEDATRAEWQWVAVKHVGSVRLTTAAVTRRPTTIFRVPGSRMLQTLMADVVGTPPNGYHLQKVLTCPPGRPCSRGRRGYGRAIWPMPTALVLNRGGDGWRGRVIAVRGSALPCVHDRAIHAVSPPRSRVTRPAAKPDFWQARNCLMSLATDIRTFWVGRWRVQVSNSHRRAGISIGDDGGDSA